MDSSGIWEGELLFANKIDDHNTCFNGRSMSSLGGESAHWILQPQHLIDKHASRLWLETPKRLRDSRLHHLS